MKIAEYFNINNLKVFSMKDQRNITNKIMRMSMPI